MFIKNILLFTISYLVLVESAFVNNLQKCSIHDGECHRDLTQSIITDIGKTGIRELGIPPIDPIHLTNITVSVAGLLDITLVDGYAKGVKDCVIERFDTHIENERATMELTCDILIKGHYRLFSDSPLVKGILGSDSVHGDGNGKVKIEKLHVKFEFFYYVTRRDGEVYIKCKNDVLSYTYKINGKTTFGANNIYLGKEEASTQVVDLLNTNSKMVMDLVGKIFMDKAMEVVYVYLHKFFDLVPTKYYITEDLSQYIKS